MSLDKRMHDGRLRDPWQIPHANRLRFQMTFMLKGNVKQISIIGVPPPYPENLLKYRDEVINCNREDWFRPRFTTFDMGTIDGKRIVHRVPMLDPTTGKQMIDCRLLSVTAKCLGADV